MYQILGLREYFDQKKNKMVNRHAFFEKNWRFTQPEQLFQNIDEILSVIPQEVRWNLYWTVADCFDEGEARRLKEQWLIPFDIDDLGIESEDQAHITKHALKVLEVACTAIKADQSKVGALWSGNGLQFFIKMDKPILSEDYFDTMREQYKVVANKIQAAMGLFKIPGKVDTSVFSAARLMRLPNTENRKEKVKKAFVVQSSLEAQHFDLDEATGDAVIRKADSINKEAWKQKGYKPDDEGIKEGCEFLKWCQSNPNSVDESQWYAMLGITAFMVNGKDESHRYSEGYKGYSADETQEKYEQALRASGPRTCKDISTRWDGCPSCQHYNQITAPIMIQGPNHIPTKDTGFRKVKINPTTGKPSPGVVAYDDLIKQFLLEFEYIKVNENGMYVYDAEKKIWCQYTKNLMKAWAYEKVVPSASSNEMNEFISRMEAINVKEKDWLDRSDDRHINFNNGVLDRQTMELKPHSSEYGFKYVLPYDYNPHAQAPMFAKFLEEVCCGDQELVQLLKEFGGYAISGDTYWEHKALFLVGDGANGKSTYVDVLKGLVGQRGYSSIMMHELSKQENRGLLVNKLFNFSEETSVGSILDSSVFKALSSGGEINVRALYENAFSYRSSTKLIMACNEMPKTKDLTHGMFRRIAIAKFNRIFTDEEKIPRYAEEMLKEASGIYNILLHAYTRAKAANGFINPVSSKYEAAQYMKESDPVAQFLEDCVEEAHEEKEVVNSEVYRLYSDYCENNGYKDRILNQVHFSRRIAKITGGKLKATTIKKDGKTIKVVKGISLNQVF